MGITPISTPIGGVLDVGASDPSRFKFFDWEEGFSGVMGIIIYKSRPAELDFIETLCNSFPIL